MGKDLYNSYSEAKDVFKRVDEALNQKLSKIIFDGDENELKLTSNTQPALMAVSLAIIKVLNDAEYLYNEKLSCAKCNLSYEELEPRFFSFNSPIKAEFTFL